ncbi:MAG: T9SS type A sorting domain-containing protein, partial [Salibacteraceae bacterium]|nr:T9SS type A sorting domain-containing protein [Salibacteraceae bacterium]
NIKLYPNPTSEVLNISLDANDVLKNVIIRDVNSALVKQISNPEHNINVSELSAGNYFISIETNVGTSVIPFTVLAKN